MRGTICALAIIALFLSSACNTKWYPTLFSTNISVEWAEESTPTEESNTESNTMGGKEPVSQETLPQKSKKQAIEREGLSLPATGGLLRLVDHASNPSCPTDGVEPDPLFQKDVTWCWAASSEAVMKFHVQNRLDTRQCNIVKQVYYAGTSDNCCGNPLYCQHNGSPWRAFDAFGFGWDWVDGPLRESPIRGQVCSNGPFIFVLSFKGGGGHTLVVRDYEDNAGKMSLWVNDHSGMSDANGNPVLDANGERVPTPYTLWTYAAYKNGLYLGKRHKHALNYVQITPPQ